MLKCILFLLSESYDMAHKEYQSAIVSKLERVNVKFWPVGSPEPAGIMEIDPAHTLVVTDIPSLSKRMGQEGYFVIALYHEGNKEESFPGIRYAVEDLLSVEYSSYEEAFKRLAGIPWEILETERMLVRESTPGDVEEFYRIYSSPSITYYMEDLFPDREQEMEYMKAYIEQVYGFYGFGLWTVIKKDTGQIIGRAGLNVREGYEIPELGFIIDVEHQRQGYGYEVCCNILDYAREKLEFDQVQAFVDKENQASIRLLEKLGFSCKGIAEFNTRYQYYVKVL